MFILLQNALLWINCKNAWEHTDSIFLTSLADFPKSRRSLGSLGPQGRMEPHGAPDLVRILLLNVLLWISYKNAWGAY